MAANEMAANEMVANEMVSAEELAALRDSVADVLRRRGEGALRAAIESDGRIDRELWQTLCEQIGVAALAIPEAYGGAGATWAETAAVVEEFGATLAALPMLSSAVISTGALLLSGDETACNALLPGLAAGESTATLCWADSRDWQRSGIVAEGGLLNGTAEYVINGESAGVLLVLAGTAAEPAPTTLHHLPASTPGVEITPLPVVDPTRPLARVSFTDVPATAIVARADLFARVRTLTWAMLAIEQVGAAQSALDRTVEYTKSRKQFGRVIGSFQALKHRMADMYTSVETARSIAHAAVTAVVAGDADADELAAAAHVSCSEAFRSVTAEAIQLHGGIGITWEHDIQLYYKRAQGSAILFGQPHEVVAELSASL